MGEELVSKTWIRVSVMTGSPLLCRTKMQFPAPSLIFWPVAPTQGHCQRMPRRALTRWRNRPPVTLSTQIWVQALIFQITSTYGSVHRLFLILTLKTHSIVSVQLYKSYDLTKRARPQTLGGSPVFLSIKEKGSTSPQTGHRATVGWVK